MLDKTNWDDISSEYDQCVEENRDPVIVNYMQKEMNIVSELCRKVRNKNNTECSVIEMGSGTGRVIYSLNKILKDNSISFYGVEISEHMLKKAIEKRKQSCINENITFLMHDSTDPKLCELFKQDTTNIVMCLYNTLGVIPLDKRITFIDNMLKLAGRNGLAIISAFNGDNFGFVAPTLYMPMKKMIKQIDEDSFDEKNRVFQNKLGYHSQWFTKNELTELLKSDTRPIPINDLIDGKLHTLGHVFVNREP